MTADDRQRAAYHESSHALARWLYGWPIAVVSIRPGAGHLGIVMGQGPIANLGALIDGRHPLDGLDPAARRLADQAMVICTIGDVAASLFFP